MNFIFFAFQPFAAKERPKALHVLMAIFVTWIIAIVIAVLPILPQLQSIFVNEAYLPENPFFVNAFVDFESARDWITKLLIFDPQLADLPSNIFIDISYAKSWYDLQDIVQKSSLSSPYFQPKQFLG